MAAETLASDRQVRAIEQELREERDRLRTAERRVSELERKERKNEERIERLERELKAIEFRRQLARGNVEFTCWAVLIGASCLLLITQLAG